MQFQSLFCQNLYMGLYIILEVARGQRPLVKKYNVFCELNMHNIRPFKSKFIEIYDFGGCKGQLSLS